MLRPLSKHDLALTSILTFHFLPQLPGGTSNLQYLPIVYPSLNFMIVYPVIPKALHLTFFRIQSDFMVKYEALKYAIFKVSYGQLTTVDLDNN